MLLAVDVEASAARRMLDRIADRLERPRGILSDLADELAEYEQHQFATSGEGTWDPLAAVTMQLKGSGRILVDHGDLERELTNSSAADIDDDAIELVTRHPAASYLKSGTSRMPARDPAPTPDSGDVRGWANTFLKSMVSEF